MGAGVRRNIGLTVAMLVVVASTGGGYWWMKNRIQNSQAAATPVVAGPVPVQVLQVRPAPIRNVVTYAGAIQASRQVSIAPRAAGQIAAIYVDVGSVVRAGDAVAALDQGTMPALLLQAQANLDAADAKSRLTQQGPTTSEIATATQALLTAQNAVVTNQTVLDGLLARATSASDATRLRQQVDAMTAQRQTAQRDFDAATTGPAADADPANARIRAAVADLDTALRGRCGNLGNRDDCAAAATTASNVRDLVSVIERRATNVTVSLESALASYVALASASATARIGDTVFRLLQSTAALPGLNARLTNLAFSLSGAAGTPTDDQIANATRARDAANAAVVSARDRLDTLSAGATNSDLQAARATVSQAQAQLAIARANLDQTVLRAPFDGVIAQKMLDVGAPVSTTTPVFTLTTVAVEVHLTVDETRATQIRPDMPAEAEVPGYPSKLFRARVAGVAPTGDTRAHTFDVKVFVEDPAGQLQPGMCAQVGIVLAQRSDAIQLPVATVVQQGQTSRVFAVVDGKAVARVVRVGVTDGANIEIVEGVAVGDSIVVFGQNTLRDGQAVLVATPPAGPGGAPRPQGSGTPGAGTPRPQPSSTTAP